MMEEQTTMDHSVEHSNYDEGLPREWTLRQLAAGAVRMNAHDKADRIAEWRKSIVIVEA
jgi:hypothetical protein